MDDALLSVAAAIESCDAQAELAYRNWNDRRQYEWKISFGFWLLVAIGAGVFVRDVRLDPTLYAAGAAAAFLVYASWLYNIWAANEYDRRTMAHYRQQSQALLANPSQPIEPFPFAAGADAKFRSAHLGAFRFLFDWPMRAHLLIAVLFLGVSFLFVTGTVETRAESRMTQIEQSAAAAVEAAKANGARIDQLKAAMDAAAQAPPSQRSSSTSRRRRGSRGSSSSSSAANQ